MWPLTKGQIPAIQRQSASHKEIIDMLNTCMKLTETFKTGDEASQLKGVEGGYNRAVCMLIFNWDTFCAKYVGRHEAHKSGFTIYQ